jgi:tetratricopeptide (TPR) repeat protein
LSFESDTEKEPLTPELEAQLKAVVVDRAPAALTALDAAETEEDIFYSLPGAALAALHLERYKQAEELARKCLEMAPSHTRNWNYGNAIHAGHTVLGLVALHNGELSIAVAELEKSGETPGSPQLGSFGPTMQLAKALLRNGETEAVLAYLQQCRAFWKMGGEWLDIWERKIKADAVPNFFMHSFR